jgi:hypothetical protein
MSSEVTRFQLARGINRSCDREERPPIRLAECIDASTIETLSKAADKKQKATELLQGHADAVWQVGDVDFDDFRDELLELEAWLTCHDNTPTVEEAVSKIEDIFPAGSTSRESYSDSGIARLSDACTRLSGLLTMFVITGGAIESQQSLSRLLRVVNFITWLVARLSTGDDEPAVADVEWALLRRPILLPDVVPATPLRSRLARRPGWADLYIVREEWNRYVAGDIAHIENIMPHEDKVRDHTRTDEAETTLVDLSEQTIVEQFDTQTTSRNELTKETGKETSAAVHVDGQIDTSGQYGPTKIDTHLGGSVDSSTTKSDNLAITLATEVVARVAKSITTRTMQQRTVRKLSRIEERNYHRLNNTESGPAVGMYRWVDKWVRLQTVRYPHRFLIEFHVPEPAAFIRHLQAANRGKGLLNEKPAHFTLNGLELSAGNPRLSPADISDDTSKAVSWLTLANRWGAIGVKPPPAKEVVATGWLNVSTGNPVDATSTYIWDIFTTPLDGTASQAAASSVAVTGQPITVPEGYEVDTSKQWEGWFSSYPAHPEGGLWEVTLTIGDSKNAGPAATTAELVNVIASGFKSISKPISGAITGRTTGKLPITITATGAGDISTQVSVKCKRLDDGALLMWQLETFELLRDAYNELQQAYENELREQSIAAGIAIEGSPPAENERICREELKRSVVELLQGSLLNGFDDITKDAATGLPRIKIDESSNHASNIQFIEQAFEWEKLSYVLYPYFWADDSRWAELQSQKAVDSKWAAFLRAGAARVVVSARPGYSSDVLYYLAYGTPWGGGVPPIPADPDYVSVADEIEAQTGAPDDGEPVGSTWEVQLPTTLLCLDPDPVLPKINTEAKLPDPVAGGD